MNAFLTLVKREIADSRGSLVFTPLIVSALIIVMTVLSIIGGSAKLDDLQMRGDIAVSTSDGERTIEFGDEGGADIATIMAGLTTEQRRELSAGAIVAAAAVSLLVMMVMAVTTVFTLLGSLYEERKDRSILFWKSLPVSDAMTVLAKFAAPAFAGFGGAAVCAIAVQAVLMVIIMSVGAAQGVGGEGWGVPLEAMLSVWIGFILLTLNYVLLAAPAYAWLLVASAASPKSPFLIAFVPIALLGLVEAALDTPFSLAAHVFERLTGALVAPWLADVFSGDGDLIDYLGSQFLPAVAGSFLRVEVALGLIAAGGLLLLASEIRRRRIS